MVLKYQEMKSESHRTSRNGVRKIFICYQSFTTVLALVNIPLLDRENYLTWHKQMLNLISSYGLEDHINGMQIEPHKFVVGTQTVNPEYATWSCINRILKSRIFASVISINDSSH